MADIGALAVDHLLEIGPDLSSSEHRFVRRVNLLSATRARVRLDSGLLMPHQAAPAAVRRLPLPLPLSTNPPTANLDPSARAGETMLFVDVRHGAFDTRTDLIVINSADAATCEVRRIGELHSVTIAPAAADAYAASSLVEGVTLTDDAVGVVMAATDPALPAAVQVSDITTLSVGQTLLVGPPGGVFETVVIQSIAPRPGAAPAGTVTLTAAFAATGGEQVIAVRTLKGDAPAGASFVALDNRLGLSPGDVIRIGAIPDDEYALVAAIPDSAPAGVRPDAGTVLLASSLLLAHARATTPVVRQDIAPVVPLYPTVTALAVARGDEQMLLSDGAGYGSPHLFVKVTTAAAIYFHRVVALTPTAPAPGAVIPQVVERNAPLDLAHPVGTAVIGRHPLFDVEALDAGVWGDRLRVSVEDEDPGLVSRTTLASVGLPTQIRLGSTSGVEPGTILELLDPATGAPVGGLLKVGLVNRLTGDITLDGTGLDAGQQAAHAAAIGAGTQLGVRSREFRLTVRLLRQPDPANPSRNETVLPNVELFRYLSMDPRHSRFAEAVIGAINGPLQVSDRRPEGESWYIRVADRAPNLAAQLEIRLGPETLSDVLPDGRLRAARHPLRQGNDSIGTLTDAAYVGVDDPTPENRTGLQSLRNVEEISIVACPGRTGSQIQLSLIEHCELMRYRFAVLDGPRPPLDSLSDVQNQRQQYDTKYAALYHPWLLIPDPFPVNPLRIPDLAIAPAGHVVGVYARTDIERGVHKAPANEVIRGITGLQRVLNKEQQDILNPSPVNINVLRDFRPYNRGIRVYGGRCITSDPDWKYVNVRRLLIFIEASIDRGLQWVVFEPNAEPLWARVRRSISNFLTLVWRNGGLEGTKAEEAYFVKCDRTTMTQTDIDNGRLICVVGVAPVKPAEFVIIRIGLWTAHAED
ncbi:MAG: phage tail sheath family protein [Solirubrobacteraceae bacterium]